VSKNRKEFLFSKLTYFYFYVDFDSLMQGSKGICSFIVFILGA